MKNILSFLIIGLFLISFSSAWTNTDFVKDDLKSIDTTTTYGKYTIEKSKWWDVLKIWTNEKVKEIELKENTDVCSNNCMSILEINLLEDGNLVEDVLFKRSFDNKKTWVDWEGFSNWNIYMEKEIDVFKTQCIDSKELNINGTVDKECSQVKTGTQKIWQTLDLNKEDKAGLYKIKLEGRKKGSTILDWQIKTSGVVLDGWAVWGNISLGDEAEVRLNSPADTSIQYSPQVTLNATGNVTGGATLVNVTLFDNSTGSWGVRNSSSVTESNIYINETNGMTPDQVTGAITTKDGMKFLVKTTGVKINSFLKISTTTASTCYLLDSSKAVLNSTSFSGNRCVFSSPISLTNGQQYYVAVDSGGGSYTRSYRINSGGVYAYPVNRTFINWTSGLNSGADHNDYFDIISIELTNSSTTTTNLTQIFNNTYSSGQNILWNMKFCDSDGDCGMATSNRTFTMDTGVPQFTINSGSGLQNYGKLGNNHTINITTTDTNLATCWYNYNSTNTTFSCTTGVLASVPLTLYQANNSVTFYANDSLGNINSTSVSWNYKVFENSRSYETNRYETDQATYSINITPYDSSKLTAVKLILNGTEYTTTQSGLVWSRSIDIPSSMLGSQYPYFEMTYDGADYNSTNSTQTILPISFGLCSGSLTVQYLNITFKDESDLSAIQGAIQSSTWEYYLGNGTQTKEYLFSNNTENTYYTFCASPGNKTYYISSINMNYLSSGYPIRAWIEEDLSYTNSSTSKILYLLSEADGIYSTFVTVSSSNTILSGVTIVVTRLLGGVSTTVGQSTTDSAGSATFWLNPSYSHTIYATKSGYGSSESTIYPTQSTYTIILQLLNNYTYTSNTDGLLWAFFPSVGILNTTTNNFGFNVTSYYGDLVGCKIELLDKSKETVLSSNEYLTTNSSICSVYTTYTVTESNPQIKGRLLVDLGGGYQILEEDAFWIGMGTNTTGMTFSDWFTDMKDFDLRYFAGGTDEIKTQHREFTQILLFFLVATIIVASMNMYGWDVQERGGMVFLMWVMVWFASIPGFLILTDISPFSFIDKYFVAMIYTLFIIGHVTRRYS